MSCHFFMGWVWARQEEGRYPPGGVSTPGHGQGEGPVGYKFPPSGGDAGDNGRGRSEAESSGRVSPFLPQDQTQAQQKRATSSHLDFLVTLFFFLCVISAVISSILGDVVIRKGCIPGVPGGSCHFFVLSLFLAFKPSFEFLGIICLDFDLYEVDRV